MRLAKPRFDIGLATNDLEPMLQFWQEEVGAPFDHRLQVWRTMAQHRHDLRGSVLKINHHSDPLPQTPPSGYVEALVAARVAAPKTLGDPDGNRVTLAPAGHMGVTQIGVKVVVRDLEAQRRFYLDALGLMEIEPASVGPEAGRAIFRAGESVIVVEQADDAPRDAPFEGKGWRYLTLQVFAVDSEHAHVLAHGGREGRAPKTLGNTARISMVLDPAGNWIELSQRASITGTLEPR